MLEQVRLISHDLQRTQREGHSVSREVKGDSKYISMFVFVRRFTTRSVYTLVYAGQGELGLMVSPGEWQETDEESDVRLVVEEDVNRMMMGGGERSTTEVLKTRIFQKIAKNSHKWE